MQPRVDALLEHIKWDRPGAKDDVMKFSDVEVGAEFLLSQLTQFKDFQLPYLVGIGLSGP